MNKVTADEMRAVPQCRVKSIDCLFDDFDRLIQSPESVHRLRRFILDLAVRGKLVRQDANDEPASELLKQIAEEKARLVTAKKIPKQTPFIAPDASEVSFSLPSSWVWCPSIYPSYMVSEKGKKIQTKDVVRTGKFPVVDQGKVLIRGYHNDANKVIRIKEPLVLFGDHTREVKLIEFDFIVGADGVKLLQPVSLHAPYYFLALQWLPLKSRGYGRHFKLLKASFIPLPPLDEQHRIVAKVDELMALCDRLEAARAEREATRDRMATASLAKLNTPDPDPETSRRDVAFALNNLTPLTTRPDQIKALRQTILNLAVRGKLVPQDPNDEPASKLLKRITAEKGRLVRAGKIKKPKPFLKAMVEPFSIPESWCWLRLGELGLTQTGATPANSHPEYYGSDIPFIKPNDLHPKHVDYSNKGLSWSGANASGRIAQSGSVLMVCIGTIGKCQLIHQPCSFNQQINAISAYADTNSHFILYSLRSSYFQLAAWSASARTTIAILNKGNWEQLPVPLPPLAEQHRIVAKVEELMALCDRLEASLEIGDPTRHHLLGARLHEALEEDGDR